MHFDPATLSIYLVTDTQQCVASGRTVTDTVQQAAHQGVTLVQIRDKEASARDFLAMTLEIAKVMPKHIPLLINDRVDIFLAAQLAKANVAGMHIGQTELPATTVRQLIGPHAILGVSAASEETLLEAQNSQVVDYVGIGPLHDTQTKKNAPAGRGFEAMAQLRSYTHLPAVAIGGITASDLPPLRAAGFNGAAVVSAICKAPDPGAAAHALAQQWRTTAG
ncbi:thiamine phosphate synthase [Lampropedia puyangensis]|uniref:Thiamine-phosphate synthase n=1 Tax=Lampropedia puyangensis TaxID=1330072 RepID=A0A4V4GS40_9BURK|nr:thiamine phosphate synthase [Lampropedia puyangensis]THU04066.1 thiamine phosphate synthase [Lampropedia puyangensis]